MMPRTLLAGLFASVLALGVVTSAEQQASPQQAGQQPVFRTGATFVRVDAFVTKNGEPVADLKPEEVEIREDDVPQAIRTFEYVNIPPGMLQTGERRDPNTVQESREAAGDPRRRVFVLFLDTYHVTQGAGMSSRPAMLRFLQRMIGPDDLIAGMTPQMAPESITFATRTAALEAMLNSIYGQRDSIIDDEEERRLAACFSSQEWPMYRDRRRAKLSLDAMETLVFHLDGIREERKAIILVTEGWPLFRDDIELSSNNRRPPSGPGIVVGPGGRLGTVDAKNPEYPSRGECDGIRMQIAAMDTAQQFRDLPDIANRANASFYTVDPRGLAVFDAPITQSLPPVNVDQAILRQKLSNLRELAERTDGLAVQNTNDLTGALSRIARDLSAYYLIGYDSTNPKLDGTYRKIALRVTRPGVAVRARRGYRAPIDGRRGVSASGTTAGGRGSANDSGGAASGNGGGAGAAGAGGLSGEVSAAVSSLTATRADLPIRLRAAVVRLAPSATGTGTGSSAATATAGAPAAAASAETGATAVAATGPGDGELRVLAELNPKVAANPLWQQGGTARIIVRGPDGESVATSEAPLGVGDRILAAKVPLPAAIRPGEYRVQVRLTNAAKMDSVGDSVAFSVPEKRATIAEPAVLRRGPSTGVHYVPTADLRFRRQERIRLEAPFAIPITRVRATVVDQQGRPMSLPVQVTERVDGPARTLVVDVSLAPLAAAGYAIVVTDTEDAAAHRILVPLQLVP